MGAPAAARAADPGRWVQTEVSSAKGEYYQGVTHDPAGRLFFDGFVIGGYRTSPSLAEQARNEALLPADVTASDGFNHIGDWTFTGGRLILPLECYSPGNTDPAHPGDNTCKRGAFGVASPDLAWQGLTPLDPAEIPKAMWAEASPDGSLVWTSTGQDLIAYRTADIVPGGPVIHPVRRLPGAVPPSGITGATFIGGRLLLAGQAPNAFQVWSVDVGDGSRRLEIQTPWRGESEGLDHVDALGGELLWQVQPIGAPAGTQPTFGAGHAALVAFVAKADAKIRLQRTASTKVRAVLRYAGRDHLLQGVKVRGGATTATTGADGVARIVVPKNKPVTLTATKAPLTAGTLTVKPAR